MFWLQNIDLIYFFVHSSYDKIILNMSKIKINKITHKRLVSYGMFFVAIIAPLSNYPQIYKLFTLKVTEGLSVETWVMYLIFGFIQLVYAISNSIKPLILSNILWILVEIVMIYGIISLNITKSPPEYSTLLIINNIGKSIMGFGLILCSSAAAMFAYDYFENSKYDLTKYHEE